MKVLLIILGVVVVELLAGSGIDVRIRNYQ